MCEAKLPKMLIMLKGLITQYWERIEKTKSFLEKTPCCHQQEPAPKLHHGEGQSENTCQSCVGFLSVSKMEAGVRYSHGRCQFLLASGNVVAST